ncbi:hypothetical protein [Bosea sp. RAC05]|uniref:hypothetical protein n=1 Tax=Bosea sp. RAC05 TaxID=1842539 RepID=UPI0012376CB9|nr:hypothetical protein [Bosea sp. RAC05]
MRDVLARDRRRLSSIRDTIEGAGLTPVACIAAPIGLGKGVDATAAADHAGRRASRRPTRRYPLGNQSLTNPVAGNVRVHQVCRRS